jgi:DNA polymerase I
MTNTPKYLMVSSKASLTRVLKRCVDEGPTALDFETTSLVPSEGRVRLVSLCNDKVHALVDFDRIKGGFRAVAKLFHDGEWIVFNRGFEQRWFNDAGCPATRCRDVGNLRKAILGGGNYKLAQLLAWDLDIPMDKTEQTSDWGAKKLRQEQLDYAYLDADRTWRLWQHWSDQADQGHWRAFAMFDNMVPAVIEMEEAGMLLDIKQHQKLVDHWEEIRDAKINAIRDMVGEDEVAKITSDSQWSDYFAANMPDSFLKGWPRTEKTGQLSMKGETLRKLAGAVPGTPLETFFDTLADFKTITKYLSSFGSTLITKSELARDKRVRARFNIGAAKTGRFSSSDPNLQQVPRDKELLGEQTSVRRSFVAGMGRRLVSLDYSGIELRVLGLLADDQQLIQDMVEGDIHSEVAAKIAGHTIDKNTKEGKAARSAAKGVSFGIIYGSGAAGLAVNMRTSQAVAQGYIDFWQDRYPKAFNLRYDMMDEVSRTKRIRMIDGGTVYMGKKPDLPKCSNYPVQRAALSIMAAAIARHKESLDAERAAGRQRLTQFLSTIHDAIIDEAATGDCKKLLPIMYNDMKEAYLDVFPGAPTDRLVEGGIGPNWGELKEDYKGE